MFQEPYEKLGVQSLRPGSSSDRSTHVQDHRVHSRGEAKRRGALIVECEEISQVLIVIRSMFQYEETNLITSDVE